MKKTPNTDLVYRAMSNGAKTAADLAAYIREVEQSRRSKV